MLEQIEESEEKYIPGSMPTMPSTCVKLACNSLSQCITLPDPFPMPIKMSVQQCLTLASISFTYLLN